MSILTLDLADKLLRSAMVMKRADEATVAQGYVYKKLYREDKDNLFVKQFMPEIDVPLLQKTLEGNAAPVGNIYMPYSLSLSPDDYKNTITIGENAILYDQTKEIVGLKNKIMTVEQEMLDKYCALPFNNAFTAGYTGADGKVLCATDHPLKAGGTNPNCFASSYVLNVANVQSAVAYMLANKNEQGTNTPKTPRYLVVGVHQWALASEICEAVNKSGVFSNDPNVLRTKIHLEAVVWKNISSSTAWFLVCPPDQNGLILYITRALKVTPYVDAPMGNLCYVLHMSFKVGWFDYRGVFGDPGTG